MKVKVYEPDEVRELTWEGRTVRVYVVGGRPYASSTIRLALGVTQVGPDLTVLRFLNWLDSMTAWVGATGPAPDGGDGRGAASYPEWVVRALMDIVQDDHERLMRALETMLGHAKEEAS